MAGCEKPLIAVTDKDSEEDHPELNTPNPGSSTPPIPGSPTPPTPPNPGSKNTTWYVSAGGNDSSSGTEPAAPLGSVQAALTRIKSIYRNGKWPAGESAVIVISGTITGSGVFGSNKALVDISGKGNYPPIILTGDPLLKGVLDANRTPTNDGRVLYIANNKVTLSSNLTLTGGYTLWGGGVLVGTPGSESGGEFVIAGGEISGNTSQNGGGVMVYKGTMTMTAGVIKNNTIAEYNTVLGAGGGVFLSEGTSFTMSDGTISENGGPKADTGGGVFINGKAKFTMAGGEILKNSSISGGGVYVAGYGKFFMDGGTIRGNTSTAASGGVYVSVYSTEFVQTGGTISGNTP
ncbi:MAG: hypothetical protein LBP71_05050 [Spirochaetaceae bacterium]|nr:hypothetical protein [Spirochaetaceae bacterium]